VGCDTALIGSYLLTFRDSLSVPSSSVKKFLDCLTLDDGTDSLSRNVGLYPPTLRNIPEERRHHLHHGGSLKSRMVNRYRRFSEMYFFYI
jgi:hypothetical protein